MKIRKIILYLSIYSLSAMMIAALITVLFEFDRQIMDKIFYPIVLITVFLNVLNILFVVKNIDDKGNKITKAIENGVTILTIADFEKML